MNIKTWLFTVSGMAVTIATLSVALLMQPKSAEAQSLHAVVHKTPTCGCCTAYADYLRQQGFSVSMVDHENMTPIRQRLGTDKAPSCHTVEIGDYVVEGHVPVASIRKMLSAKPNIKGIALPGMPLNAPGMGPEKKGSLNILSLDKQGNVAGVYQVE